MDGALEAADFLARLDTGSKDEFVRSSLEYQRSLMAMRLGKELGLSAVAVMDLPAHWLGSAMIALGWQRLESETASKRRRGGKPTASPRGKR